MCPVISFIVLPICFLPLFGSWLCGLKGFINSLDPRLGYMSRQFCVFTLQYSYFVFLVLDIPEVIASMVDILGHFNVSFHFYINYLLSFQC